MVSTLERPALTTPAESAIVMSIHPRWVDAILSGHKTFELRRRAPDRELAKGIMIYSTAPTSALVAIGDIQDIVRAPPQLLWSEIGTMSGCSKAEFFQYFEGVNVASALKLTNVRRISPLPLALLRSRIGWHPPVSWMKATEELIQLAELQ